MPDLTAEMINSPAFIERALQHRGTGTDRRIGSSKPADEADDLVKSSVLVPLVERPGGLHVIMIMRSARLRHHPGQIGFPGGKVEPGDPDSQATVLRETLEEIGIAATDIRILGTRPPQLTTTGFVITPHIGLVAPHVQARPVDGEVAEVFEVPLEVLAWPDDYTTETDPVGGKQLVRHVIHYKQYRIWGATGRILYTLADHLNRCASRN